MHQRDVRPQLRRGLGDLQAEVLGSDGAHPHHRTGGQQAEGEKEAGGDLPKRSGAERSNHREPLKLRTIRREPAKSGVIEKN